MKNSREKWVGLIRVVQVDGVDVLGIDRGAFATTIAWCDSELMFRSIVESALAENGLRLVGLKDVDPCEERLRESTVPEDFMAAMAEVGPESPVVFLDFHTYPLHEDGSEEDVIGD